MYVASIIKEVKQRRNISSKSLSAMILICPLFSIFMPSLDGWVDRYGNSNGVCVCVCAYAYVYVDYMQIF